MAAPPERPNLRARYDLRRQALVDAAARLFALQGFQATSMADIASASGLTAGGIYHYIASKDDLLVLICDDLMEPVLAQIEALSAQDVEVPMLLAEIVRCWVAHVVDHRDHVLVFNQERHVLERGPRWRRIRQQRRTFEATLSAVLDRGERDGTLHFSDRELSLRALEGMINHTVQWYRPRGRLGPREIADGYVDLLLGR